MPASVSDKIQWCKPAEEVESNGKNLATLEPGVAAENTEPEPRECGIGQDRDSDIARHVAARHDKFEPCEQKKEYTARPNAEPWRVMCAESKAVDAATRRI